MKARSGCERKNGREEDEKNKSVLYLVERLWENRRDKLKKERTQTPRVTGKVEGGKKQETKKIKIKKGLQSEIDPRKLVEDSRRC
jgi:hypothetical protein